MSATEPLSYEITLAPDLDALEFSGRVTIELMLSEAGAPVILDAERLSFHDCSVYQQGIELDSSYTVDDSSITISCPAAKTGRTTVSLGYTGKLSDDLTGFYDAPYKEDNRIKHLAVTQFESESARRAFPCFDRPRYNTPFSITLEVPLGAIGVATAPVEEIIPLESGISLYKFETTPPMPTYLLFFGVGNFESIEDRDFSVPVRTLATPGKAAYGREAMEIAKASIQYCEEFTGIPYPVGKLDLIALPAFAYGAMENLGAITYREHLLLYYPDTTSRRGLERNALITAHETAHMWFGDLVSPLEWRFVWLNEAFATYLEYIICDAASPDWHIGDRFLLDCFIPAFYRDSLINTEAIEPPEGDYLEVDASTAPIVYQKAGLVLRMAHLWLGKEEFTAGVRSYLSTFAFQSTDTAGFLESFGKGAGPEAARMIENWIRQPGFPIVRAERSGRKLLLTQSRFTWLDFQSNQVWHIPVSILLFDEHGERNTISLLLTEKSTELDLPDGTTAYKINAGNIGFFHAAYDLENLHRLGALYRNGELESEDRYGLLSDLTALTMSREIDVEDFMDFLHQYCGSEAEYLPLNGISDALILLWRLLPAKRGHIAEVGRDIFEPVYDRVGVVPSRTESYLNVLLRDTVLWPLLLFGSGEVSRMLLDRFERFKAGKTVEPDLLRFALVAGATSNDAGFDVFRKAVEDPDTTGDVELHAYEAMGWFPDEETLTEVLAYTEKSVAEQNRIYVYRALAANPSAGRLLYSWLERNLRNLGTGHPYLRSIAVVEFIPVCEPENESDLDTLLEDGKSIDAALAVIISMAKERREVFRALGSGGADL